MLLRTHYRKLLDFAFIPKNILHAVRVRDNAVGDHLFAYLCFAFEHAQPENLMISEKHAIFAPGLQNIYGYELYCRFEENRNQKQKWALAGIETSRSLMRMHPSIRLPRPVNALSAFNLSFYQFAFVQRSKLEIIAPYFDNDMNKALLYIMHLFRLSNIYGYIIYDKDYALLNMGPINKSQFIYAVMEKNPNQPQPWRLTDFVSEGNKSEVTQWPDFVLGYTMQEIKQNAS